MRIGLCRPSVCVRVAAIVVVGVVALGLQARADRHNERKYKPPPPTATISVTVLRGTNGKAIPNAAVVFHPIKDGKDEGALELKSDEDGKVTIDVIPVGDMIRLQVIADGWQTFGQDYQIPTDKKDIVVKLKRPGQQYSLYKDSNEAPVNNTTPKGQSSSAKPNSQTPLPQ